MFGKNLAPNKAYEMFDVVKTARSTGKMVAYLGSAHEFTETRQVSSKSIKNFRNSFMVQCLRLNNLILKVPHSFP